MHSDMGSIQTHQHTTVEPLTSAQANSSPAVSCAALLSASTGVGVVWVTPWLLPSCPLESVLQQATHQQPMWHEGHSSHSNATTATTITNTCSSTAGVERTPSSV